VTDPGTNSIVFVRHGEPVFPGKKKFFLGKTDWELSYKGKARPGISQDGPKAFPGRDVSAAP
jgi:hypothetical protein